MDQLVHERSQIEQRPNSRLARVIVSRGRAQVWRELEASLEPGAHTLFFEALGGQIDESNIRAAARDSRARVLSATLEKRNLYFYNKEENEQLAREAAAGLRRLIELADGTSVLAVEAGLIACLRDYLEQALGDILLEQNIAITRLKDALDFLRELLDKNRADAIGSHAAAAAALEEYRRLSGLLQKAARLDHRVTHRLRLEVECAEAVTTVIEAAYTTAGAEWRMSYDALLLTEAKGLSLSVFGEIRQSTGEDWSGADIVLSSAETDAGIDIPEIHPVRLSGYKEETSPEVMTAEEEISESAGAAGEAVPSGTGSAPPEKTLTAYAFTLSHAPAVPSDDLWHRLLVRRDECRPVLTWETVPALMEYVYLKAVFSNASGAPLLPGRVQIYRNGSYIGATESGYRAAGEECALSFGIDLDLKVKRIVVKDRYSPPRALSTRARRDFSFKYVLSHFKNDPVTLVLKEPIHLSEVEKVKVIIGDDTSPGYALDREGVVSFESTVPAGRFARTVLKLTYAVEGPASYGLENL